ncbi:hypothetical protein BASA61_004997 [Batrachochytrium salamandrivorans]|nr:hypothetical protein BASA62_004406 [Batrachochytrium salamandrivorans]KAH6591279.1 hypothetical protein BASA61_004997 [Batrachochytrium salamandrivorans]KAH9246852.1 hypothetical protein BASA81_015570 [Batrachochytrium salamandrivorans]
MDHPYQQQQQPHLQHSQQQLVQEQQQLPSQQYPHNHIHSHQQPYKPSTQRLDVSQHHQSPQSNGMAGNPVSSYTGDTPVLKRARVADTLHPYQPPRNPMLMKAAAKRGILTSGYEVVNGPFSDSRLQRRPPRPVPIIPEFQADLQLQRENREREADAERVAAEARVATLGTWVPVSDSKFNNNIMPVLPFVAPSAAVDIGSVGTNGMSSIGGIGNRFSRGAPSRPSDLNGLAAPVYGGGSSASTLHDLIMSRHSNSTF